ncbi:tape measure protein [Bifidobacterium vansinderenii]|uniref:Transglycosylase SLT domain-containing protein n=1 Tax=Bifidobacterium vansinderenii TaxID=1984871 RepID=A0A229VW78_9BIFI|nr:tape measure protein [Bifidobacterium vansinderenii]OXM99874.1 Transglycosylase SLT domain-containing protein [Bifidobacterium vansinderenii]
MAEGTGVEVAKAFVTILPAMPGIQREISSAFGAAGTAADKAGREAGSKFEGSFARGLKGISGSLKSLAGMAAGALAGIGFAEIAKDAVEASDATKKFGNTLKFAGKSDKDIQRLTASTQKYADETVYDLSDIQNVTAQLAANGVKNYDKLAEASGNLNAAAGGNKETFKSVAMMLTQTAGAGKLTTENWNQLADAIPGASGLLQDAMKKNGAYTGNFRDAMADGQITAEEFNDAIMQLGMNDGAIKAAKTTDTFEGAWGNLQASIQKGAVEIVNTAMPMITKSMSWAADRFMDFAAWFEKAWHGITDLVTSGSVSKELQEAFNIPDTAIGPITSTVWKVRNLWSGMIDFIKTGDFTQEFNNAFLGVDQDTVNSIKDSLSGIRDSIKEFIDSLPKLKANLEKTKPSLDGFGASLTVIADTLKILKPVIEIIGKLGTTFNNLPAPVQSGMLYLGLFALGVGKLVKPVVNVIKLVGRLGKSIVGAFKFVSKIPGNVGNAVSKIGGKLRDLKAFIDLLPDYLTDIGSRISGVFSKIKNIKPPAWLSKLGSGIGNVFGKIGSGVNKGFEGFGKFMARMSDGLDSLTGKITGGFKSALSKAGSLFDDLASKAGSAVSKIGKGFTQLGKSIPSTLSKGLSKVGSLLSKIKLPPALTKTLPKLLGKGGGKLAGVPGMLAGMGIQEYFNWSDKSKTTGQKYSSMIFDDMLGNGDPISNLLQSGGRLFGLDTKLADVMDSSGASAELEKEFTQAIDTVRAKWSELVEWFKGLPEQIGSAFSQIPTIVGGWFTAAVQWVQSTWTGVTAWFSGLVQQIGGVFGSIPGIVGGWFQSAWGWVQGVWSGVAGWFSGVAQSVGAAFSSIPGILGNWFQQAWNWVNRIWSTVTGWFQGVARSVGDAFSGVPGRIGGLFQAAWSWVSGIWNGVSGWFQSNVWGPIQSGLNALGRAFQSTKDWISRSWDAVKEAAASPVRFVVNTVYTNGIKKVWNGIADKLGLDLKLPDVSANFARGGVMPGYTPGRDVMYAHVSGGEAIMRPEFTRAMGRDWIDRMNLLARRGGVRAVQKATAPAYANGGLVDTAKQAASAARNVVSKVEDVVVDFIADPAGYITSKIVDPVKDWVKGLTGGAWGQLIGALPIRAAEALVDKAKNVFTAGGAFGGPIQGFNASAGVAQWTPQVLQALAMLGQPASWLDTVLRRMNQESGGNPNAINLWDSNAAAGMPSQGLMQTIPPTFAAYAGPLAGRGILDPLANIYAGLNYALHRYGSLAALNRPGGYALGGIIPMLAKGGTVTQSGTVMVGERGPELLRLPQGAQVRPLERDMDRDDARIVDAINDFRDLLLPVLRNGFDSGQITERDFARLVRRYA